MSDTIRSFIAIDLPPEAKAALAALTQTLIADGLSGVRWVKPEGIHLTLKFLGNIPSHTPPRLLTALQSSSQNHPPFSLGLGDFGVFPSPNNPRVLWVGVTGDMDALSRLQASVEEACHTLGFEPDRRPFRPHLTLGRVRRKLPPPQLDLVRAALQEQTAGNYRWNVGEFHLIHSTLTPQGAIYRSLGSAPLNTTQSLTQ